MLDTLGRMVSPWWSYLLSPRPTRASGTEGVSFPSCHARAPGRELLESRGFI